MFLSLLFLFACQASHAQNLLPSLEERIRILCSDSLEGRRAGTAGERRAAHLLIQWLSSVTGEVPILDSFPFTDEDNTQRKAYNIYSTLSGLHDSFIVLVAHYDHLGWGGLRSRSLGRHLIHPGADDNASGVSLLIEIANYLACTRRRYSYIFALISAHEPGLWGAQRLAHFLRQNLYHKKMLMIVVLDMVGRMSSDNPQLYVQYFPSDTSLRAMSKVTTYTHSQFILRFEESPNLRFTDCLPMIEMGLPCILITTGYHDDYHRVSDTPEKLNYEGMRNISEYLKTCCID